MSAYRIPTTSSTAHELSTAIKRQRLGNDGDPHNHHRGDNTSAIVRTYVIQPYKNTNYTHYFRVGDLLMQRCVTEYKDVVHGQLSRAAHAGMERQEVLSIPQVNAVLHQEYVEYLTKKKIVGNIDYSGVNLDEAIKMASRWTLMGFCKTPPNVNFNQAHGFLTRDITVGFADSQDCTNYWGNGPSGGDALYIALKMVRVDPNRSYRITTTHDITPGVPPYLPAGGAAPVAAPVGAPVLAPVGAGVGAGPPLPVYAPQFVAVYSRQPRPSDEVAGYEVRDPEGHRIKREMAILMNVGQVVHNSRTSRVYREEYGETHIMDAVALEGNSRLEVIFNIS